MSNNGGPSASKNSIPPLYYPLDPASSSIPRDPIPHPDSNSYTSTGNPLPRGGDTQGLVDSREAERKKQAEPAMAQKEQEKWMKLEKEREPRMMTREQRLKEREARRILHEEELANLSEDSEKLETGQGRLSKRHLKAEIERKKQVLEELAGEEDWIFDCICGAYGQIDDGTHSIACDKCNIWQHSKCVGVSQAEADREDFHFICTRCQRRAKDAERAKNQPPIKLQVEKQVGTKRPLSKSDIHQNERAPKSPFISDIAPPKFFSLGKERHPQTANVPEQPMVFGLRGPNHATIRTEDDSDDEGKEEMDWQRDWIPVQEDSIIPNYEGFKSHALRLNPEMDPRNKWLVSRIAHQQEIRYKNLLDLRVRHSQAILRRDCGAGPNCLASGGSATFLDRKGNAVENVTQASDHGPLRLVTDFEDRDSDLEEGTIIEDLFPQGVPMPPTRKLPAEFECQLCFKVKKFIRPSDWTKHVHEDIQPFTCTFDKCKEPRSFKRKADWVCHENERHRHLEWWICQVEDCRHPCYRKTNFIQHLVREHKMPEPKQKTKAAINKAGVIDPVLLMVEECHHEATSRPQDEPCKFCGKSFPTWKKLTVHLAKHMEHISLPIIRLVEAKIVDSNTIISPVEPEFTPITPIGYEKREPNSSPFNMMNVSPVPSAQSYFTQPEYQPSNMTAAGFQREPVKASQRSSNYHPAQSPKKVPSYLHNETGDESGQTDSKGNYHQIGPSERPIDDPTASTALEEPLKGHGGPYAVSMPLIGWWRCTGSRGVVEIACGQEVSLEMDGTTCPSCGHIKCQFCESITSPTAEDLSKLGDQHANPEWDVQSLVSVNTFSDSALGSSLPSHMSGSATHELPKTAQEEILLIFFSDQKFRSLLESAASLIGKPRFTRNIRRLLVPFQRELQAAATDNREKDATRIIEKHSQWFASRLFDMSDPENKSNAYNMAAHLNQHIDKRPMLERYLASTVPKAAKTPQNLAEDTNREDIQSSSDESDSDKSEIDIENYINYSKFPNLEHIKNFIIGGATFDNLKQNIFQFLNPQKPPIPSPKISPEIPSEESFEGSGSTETTEVTIPDAELEEESDDTASIASDDPALTGASDARILDPRAYFDKLAALERDIFEVSSFLFPGTDLTARSTQGKRDLLSSEETFHFQAKIENDDVIRAIKTSSSTRLLHLLECYNIIRRTGKSLSTLRNAGYLADAITLLIMDRGFARRRVANMAQIPISKVLHLGLTFEFALKGVLSELSNLQTGHDNKDIVDSIVARQDGSHNLTMQCEDMLFTMDSMHPLVNHVCPIIWDCVVQSLQLGVLSYAGAHIQRFDLGLIGSDISSFQLPIKITYEDKTLQRIASRPGFGTLVKLRRRRFQCLDKLLGGCQPWVFHQNLYSDESDPLLLSTRIRSLTDLWGPSWKIMGERGFIQRYDIGNGSIVPWSENEDYHFSIPEINIGTLQQLPNFEHPHWNASLVSEAIDFFDFLKKSAVKLGMVKSTL